MHCTRVLITGRNRLVLTLLLCFEACFSLKLVKTYQDYLYVVFLSRLKYLSFNASWVLSGFQKQPQNVRYHFSNVNIVNPRDCSVLFKTSH